MKEEEIQEIQKEKHKEHKKHLSEGNSSSFLEIEISNEEISTEFKEREHKKHYSMCTIKEYKIESKNQEITNLPYDKDDETTRDIDELLEKYKERIDNLKIATKDVLNPDIHDDIWLLRYCLSNKTDEKS